MLRAYNALIPWYDRSRMRIDYVSSYLRVSYPG